MLEALRLGPARRSDARRRAMREVAARFPGALREWGGAPLVVLRARRRQAETALARRQAGLAEPGPDRGEPAWLALSLHVHRELARALSAKRLLAGRPVTPALAEAARARLGIDPALLEAIADPPAGRLSELVHAGVARTFGITVAALKAQLFPAGPSLAKGDEP